MQTENLKTYQNIFCVRRDKVFKNQRKQKSLGGRYPLAFLQQRFSDTTKVLSSVKTGRRFSMIKRIQILFVNKVECVGIRPLIRSRTGFVSVFLLFFLMVMISGVLGLSFLSGGIHRITKLQSYCIQISLKGQESQKQILEKILKLNGTVLFFHKTRKNLENSMIVATSLGFVSAIPALKKKIAMIKKAQKALVLRQQYLLSQSLWIKKQTFKTFKKRLKKLNIFRVWDKNFYKPSLAIKRKKEGDRAYTYKPVPNFTNHQKSYFSWHINPFSHPHLNSIGLDLSFFKHKARGLSEYNCVASLQKRGKIWEKTLYH